MGADLFVSSNLKISVITPSFNQAQFIEKAIQSVINQNYPPLNILLSMADQRMEQ